MTGFPLDQYPCDGGDYPPREEHSEPMRSVPSPDLERRDESLPPVRHEDRGKHLARNVRSKTYAHPAISFRRCGIHWQAILDLPAPIPPEHVALMLACLKVSRLTESPEHVDSQDDVDGYIETLREIVRPEGQKWHDLGLV